MSRTPDTGSPDFVMAELMAVEMARTLKVQDGRLGGVGAAAVLPMAAVRLATMTVAPNLMWFCGGSSALNPTFTELPLSAHDPRAFIGAEATFTMLDVVDLGTRGSRWGWGFNGGMQIDRFGNANMIGIGPYEKLKVRGPGTVGTLWTATMQQYYLFTTHHNPRVFVEKVDFVSSPGFMSGGESRWEVCREDSDGPQRVFTPLCVFDFEPTSRALRLRSVHPGYTVDDVIENTGCEVIVPDGVPTTTPPSPWELHLLRTQIDSKRVLTDYRLTIG
jgi:glutaconate CoA-transferase subunit B